MSDLPCKVQLRESEMNQSVSKQMRRIAEYMIPMRGNSKAEADVVTRERKSFARGRRKKWNALPWRARRRYRP